MTLYSSVFTTLSRLRLAHEGGINSSTHIYQNAAGRHASVELLVAARELGMQFSVGMMQSASRYNQLSVLQYLHAEGCPWDSRVCTIAASTGRLDILRWLRDNGCPWNDAYILSYAASSGSLDVTAWVKQQPGVECNLEAMKRAAEHGFTAICEYLYAEQCEWSSSVCFWAALNGHVDTLRWLHEHGCPWEADEICIAAAESGSLDVLKYLQQHLDAIDLNAAMLTEMLNVAGRYNKLAAAQWLRQRGAEWPAVLGLGDEDLWPEEALTWAQAEGCTSPTIVI
jgi:hypothetical protein